MPERPGLVGEAQGSTLFLDEIGELPAELQTHLLRLLDGGDYQRLGDARRRTADVRFVAATNRPVEHLKTDLAARLLLRVRAPGLHDRREDVTLLARHILKNMVSRGDAHTARFLDASGEPRTSPELAVALVRHLYTTHVRELAGVLVCAALESRGDTVDLTEGARRRLSGGEGHVEAPRAAQSPPSREDVVAALERHGGDVPRGSAWRDLDFKGPPRAEAPHEEIRPADGRRRLTRAFRYAAAPGVRSHRAQWMLPMAVFTVSYSVFITFVRAVYWVLCAFICAWSWR